MQTQMPASVDSEFAQTHAPVSPDPAPPARGVIVLPTYNESLNLPHLLPRLLELPDVDVIVVDDGSPDGTGEMADRLAVEFAPRVTVIHRETKSGRGGAVMAGFREALRWRLRVVRGDGRGPIPSAGGAPSADRGRSPRRHGGWRSIPPGRGDSRLAAQAAHLEPHLERHHSRRAWCADAGLHERLSPVQPPRDRGPDERQSSARRATSPCPSGRTPSIGPV